MDIRHHERVGGHRLRWHVHLEGRQRPIVVELPEEEREGLELTDEEIHELLPTALRRRVETHPDEVPPDEEAADVAWDSPVRVYQTHFLG